MFSKVRIRIVVITFVSSGVVANTPSATTQSSGLSSGRIGSRAFPIPRPGLTSDLPLFLFLFPFPFPAAAESSNSCPYAVIALGNERRGRLNRQILLPSSSNSFRTCTFPSRSWSYQPVGHQHVDAAVLMWFPIHLPTEPTTGTGQLNPLTEHTDLTGQDPKPLDAFLTDQDPKPLHVFLSSQDPKPLHTFLIDHDPKPLHAFLSSLAEWPVVWNLPKNDPLTERDTRPLNTSMPLRGSEAWTGHRLPLELDEYLPAVCRSCFSSSILPYLLAKKDLGQEISSPHQD